MIASLEPGVQDADDGDAGVRPDHQDASGLVYAYLPTGDTIIYNNGTQYEQSFRSSGWHLSLRLGAGLTEIPVLTSRTLVKRQLSHNSLKSRALL